MHSPPWEAIWLAGAWALLAAVVASDLRSRKIPNACVALLLLGGAAHGALGGWAGLGDALFGAAAGAALLIWPYSKGWMGAGDVKLLASIGAWVGGGGALLVLVLGAALGGVLALVTLLRLGRDERRKVRQNLADLVALRGLAMPEPSRLSKERGVPFGVPLALVGAVLLFARSAS